MKTKKRLLSFLSCMLILATSVTGVFAAEEWVPTAETDGVAKHYEYNVNASDITPETTDGNPVYNFTVPMFNDIGDTITINFKDKTPTNKTYSSYIESSDIDIMNSKTDYDYLKSMISGGHPAASELATELTKGYENSIMLSMNLYDESTLSDLSYAIKINNKLYKVEEAVLVETNTPDTYSEAIAWNIESYNAIFGTTLPEKMYDDPTTTIDAAQIQLDKIDFQLYYKGNLIETYNLADIYANPIEYNMTYTYTITYKLNEDGTVVATVPASTFMAPKALILYPEDTQYRLYKDKTSDDANNNIIYNFTDAYLANTLRVSSASANGNWLQTTIDVTNIKALKTIYDNKSTETPTEVKTVTVTPTVSVVDMPEANTKTEGFDITFKSDVPVVLTTQEAPDVSVCSITNKQADGSYTGVYHVDAIGNRDIKFNVKPTVSSTLSEDGLTKTVYNSTVYTLSIKAFDPGVSTPDIDDEDTVPDDDVTVEIPEETDPVDPSDPNGPDKIPQTGDTTPIIPLMITMLVSLTVVIFCIVHRKKAKTLLSVVLVVAMLGGTLTGIQMKPTEVQAAGNNNVSDGIEIGSTPGPAYKGDWTITANGAINFVFTLMDDELLQEYMANGWQNNKRLSQQIHYDYATMVGTFTPEEAVYNDVRYWYKSKYEEQIGKDATTKLLNKLKWENCDIYTYDANYVFVDAFFDFLTIREFCNIIGYDVSKVTPSTILDGTTYQTASFSRIQKNDTSQTLITNLLGHVANITDENKKVEIAKKLFKNSRYVSEIDVDFMKDMHIVCIPYVRTFYHNPDVGAESFLVPIGIHHMTGQTTKLHYDPYAPHTYDYYDEVKNICDKVYISEYNGSSNTKGLNTSLQYFRKWRGLGLMFLTHDPPEIIEVKDSSYSDTAYSSYINFALDNKNTTVKYTNDYTNYGGYSGWNFANSDSYITFKHNYIIRRTYTNNVLTKTEYIDKGYTSSGALNIASGTKVTGNSVFNGQGYAVSSVPSGAGVYAYPYISYKWVNSASGGIGNVWSLDIGTHPGVAYGTTNYFLSVADYKSYAGTIPTLDTIKSYLSKNANESGVNRFSNSGYVKFRADFSSPTMYNFLSIDNSVKTSLASQNENRDSVIFTATYTPVSITSNIKLVEVVQDGSTLKVKSVTDGASTSYVNTTTGSLTTPTGYKFYKAVAAGGTGVKVGDTVSATGLTSCNQTKLTVGASAIDKGYTIYCYKLPDTWITSSNISTYVGEDYVNNVDFTYTSYVSGSWKYNGAPTVTGHLTGINSAWTTKTNTILGGTLPGVSTDTVNRLAHQRTFMINANRASYQTLNLSPFVSNSAANANKNGLAGVSAQQSTNKVNTTMDSGAAAYYNNYYTVSGRKVFQPLSSLTNQVNTWKGTTDSFTVNGFTFNKAEVTYKNTTYVGVYNAPSIGTQTVTNNALTNNGKVYTEVANTGTKLEFVPHYNMKVVAFGDGSDPHAYSSRHYYNVSVMSNFKRSFNSAMLSGYTFTTGTVSGTTSSDYVDNNGDTLKGSDVTLKVSNPTLSLNTFAYVVDIYGDGDSTELINGYNPASQWGINKYSELLGKVNTKFSNYLTTVQNNLEYSVVLDNEGTKYKDFTVSTSKANPSTSVTADTQAFVLTIKNGVIVNDTAYQSMIASIKADFGLASTTEAETLFNNSGIKNMIVNSMHTSVASNNTSTGKWYDEQVNTICIRRFAKTGIQLITNAVVQDKIDYNSEKGDGEWTFIVKNGSTTILETEINGADFEISDKTTQN